MSIQYRRSRGGQLSPAPWRIYTTVSWNNPAKKELTFVPNRVAEGESCKSPTYVENDSSRFVGQCGTFPGVLQTAMVFLAAESGESRFGFEYLQVYEAFAKVGKNEPRRSAHQTFRDMR